MLNEAYAKHAEELKNDVLALAFEKGTPEGYTKDWTINGEKVSLGVRR